MIYIENMLKLSRAGALIAPASPAFYNKPKTLDDNINFIVGRVLDLLGYDSAIFSRWEGSDRGNCQCGNLSTNNCKTCSIILCKSCFTNHRCKPLSF